MGYYNEAYMGASDFRQLASTKCSTVSSKLCVVTLVYILITIAVSVLGSFAKYEYVFPLGDTIMTYSIDWISPIISLVITGPLYYGLISVSQSVYYDSMDIQVSELFSGFDKFSKTFLIYLLTSLYSFLWSLLFVIPGIIKGLSYSMSMYVYHDHPEYTPSQCIEKSKQIMDGHKWDYFCLMLSYLGWLILCVLTFGILLLWVMPKIQVASYAFYKYASEGVDFE